MPLYKHLHRLTRIAKPLQTTVDEKKHAITKLTVRATLAVQIMGAVCAMLWMTGGTMQLAVQTMSNHGHNRDSTVKHSTAARMQAEASLQHDGSKHQSSAIAEERSCPM